MNKKFLPEILGLLIIFSLAVLFAGRPGIPPFQPSSRAGASPSPPSPQSIAEDAGIKRTGSTTLNLQERNIFSDDGKYLKPGEKPKPVLPENPYTLIGVLNGKERKAVFREYTGNLVVLTKGKKLIDEAVITRIDSRSVQVKKEGKNRELKIFQTAPPKPLKIKNP